MIINRKQLRQIAAICDALSDVEHNDTVYSGAPTDATVINSRIEVRERETNRLLGHIRMAGTCYGFESANAKSEVS